ncbi:hypothetical protein ACFL20_09950 [Spirochaetota bacterium]
MIKRILMICFATMAIIFPAHIFAQGTTDVQKETQMLQEESKFKVSGFIDVFTSKVFQKDEDSIVSQMIGNKLMFNHYNLNLYFEFNPIKDLRTFVELRFLYAPTGMSSQSFDDGNGTLTTMPINNTNSGITAQVEYGTVFIERAFLEWNRFEFAKVRAGRLLTPFGIWSQDHGAPALTSVKIPDAVQPPATLSESIPPNMTGFELLGTVELPADYLLSYSVVIANTISDIEPISDVSDSKNIGFFLNLAVPTIAQMLDIEFGTTMFFGKREKLFKTDTDIFTEVETKYYEFKQDDKMIAAHLKMTLGNLPLDGTLVLQSEYLCAIIEPDKGVIGVNSLKSFLVGTSLEGPAGVIVTNLKDYKVHYFYAQAEYRIFGWITPYYRFNYTETENSNTWGIYKKSYQHLAGINVKPYPQLTIKVEFIYQDFVPTVELIPGGGIQNHDFQAISSSVSMAF